MPSKARIRAAIVALAVPAVILAGTPAFASDGQPEISDCRLDRSSGSPYLLANVSVANNDPNNEHSYNVNVVFDRDGTRLGSGTEGVGPVPPSETGESQNNIVDTDPSATASEMPDGIVHCVAEAVDENGETVGKPAEWPPPKPPDKPDKPDVVQTYTVVSGDTLSGIAEQHYGDASRWTEIYDVNRDTIEAAARDHGRPDSDNGHWIYPGTELVIP